MLSEGSANYFLFGASERVLTHAARLRGTIPDLHLVKFCRPTLSRVALVCTHGIYRLLSLINFFRVPFQISTRNSPFKTLFDEGVLHLWQSGALHQIENKWIRQGKK